MKEHVLVIGAAKSGVAVAKLLQRHGFDVTITDMNAIHELDELQTLGIHVFEKDSIPGGACDGYEYPGLGYVMRGEREMDNHFEVMWDLFRSIPSI